MRRLARASWQTHPRSAFQQQHQNQQIAALSSSSSASLSSSSSSNVVFQQYRSLVDEGKITYDPVQVRAVRHFDLLYDQLAQYGGPSKKVATAADTSGSSWWQRLTGSQDSNAATESKKTASTTTPKGLYIHGGVGCGKVRSWCCL